MPAIWCRVAFKGRRGEVESLSLLNSGSDLVVLPITIARKIYPEPKGEVEIELANGKIVKRKVYEVEIALIDKRTKQRKGVKTYATIEKRGYPLIGIMAMEKLKIIPDVIKGRVLFVKK